jgi:uncharacterized protein YndB with AHSA1/START domain
VRAGFHRAVVTILTNVGWLDTPFWTKGPEIPGFWDTCCISALPGRSGAKPIRVAFLRSSVASLARRRRVAAADGKGRVPTIAPSMLPPAMRPITVTCAVDRPRERVFDYLSDLANHVEFCDHLVKEFRLERIDSRGVGAAARFRVRCGLRWTWAEAVLVEASPPHRLLLAGGSGRGGRVPHRIEYLLVPHVAAMTKVALTVSTEPSSPPDRMRELGARTLLALNLRRALRRLRYVLEEGEPSAHAARPAPG